MQSNVLVIAEAGVNHNGQIELAKQLIDAAHQAGADVVKFQSFKAENVVTRSAGVAEYQKRATGNRDSQFDMLQSLELSQEQHHELLTHCDSCQIEILSTAFDEESIGLLSELNIKRAKIPSGEITNVPYLRLIAAMKLPTILSTGMADLGEIEFAIRILEQGGLDRQQITVLHCNTQYPTPMCDVNLRAMQTLGSAFQVHYGYSDHTMGIEVPVAAVAMGASVIEKHLTLDQGLPGPDHAASLEPAEFKQMVSAIRNVETALGSSIKQPSPSESTNKTAARRSIVAKQVIKAGEQLTTHNLAVKRPGDGISPALWDLVVGRTASRDYQPDDQIQW